MSQTKADVKKAILGQLEAIKEEDRLNFLINRLTNVEFESEKSIETAKYLKTETDRLAGIEKKLQNTEKMLSRAELSKSKLEELCRELNRSKKEEADRNVQKLREIERNHQETVENFKKSLGDIQSSVDARKEQAKRMQDVEDISKSLTSLSEEYETRLRELKTLYEDREDKVKDMMKTKDDELKHLRKEIEGMRSKVEGVFRENVELKQELLNKERAFQEAVTAEINTKKVIESYGDKYGELVGTLEKSNKAFERARTDMTKMNGQLIKLQAESQRYRKQLEESKATINQLTSINEDITKKSSLKDRQMEQLQKLCRQLQKGNPLTEETPESENAGA
ncbi:unnamed protein product [Bursaphelenchus xylophilus]|uniref:(pine wood nematode) hypothetical protein n=1 Tax=Bursaphelenchus xylophilus TaxID=6326 RepID=A0A1I7RVA3_BURXY|nr:unnamed protein product [Bursaphelenchus xylophilus]CAG9086600.1 unnamed protein product [Bursaphelenchus xylophilus]